MLKKMCIILCAATLALSLSSCGSKAKDGYIKVQDDTCPFTFEVPADWEVTYTDGMLAASDIDDVSKANVVGFAFNHVLDGGDITSKEYWDTHYKNQLCDTFGKVEFLNEQQKELGGQTVMTAQYKTTIGSEVFDCDIMLVLYGEKVYTLTLTQGEKTSEMGEMYKDYSKEFEKMQSSLRIK